MAYQHMKRNIVILLSTPTEVHVKRLKWGVVAADFHQGVGVHVPLQCRFLSPSLLCIINIMIEIIENKLLKKTSTPCHKKGT